MRTALLILASVAFAAAWTTHSEITPKSMVSGREYWYNYESQVVTGIPVLQAEYSGLIVKARVMIQKTNDESLIMKPTGIQLLTVREEPKVNPTEWLPSSVLTEMPAEQSRVITEHLTIPCKFRYENGIVSKIYADERDTYWSVNMKRGIIGMMYLDVNGKDIIHESSDLTPFSVYSTKERFNEVVKGDYTTMTSKNAFKVMEPSVFGDCETTYAVFPDEEVEKVLVSKIIDPLKCSPRMLAEKGLFAGLMTIPGVSNKKTFIRPSIEADYILSGSRHNFMIDRAQITGTYAFSPAESVEENKIPGTPSLTEMKGFIKQRLIYVKDDSIARPIPFESEPKLLTRGLHMAIPDAAGYSDPGHLSRHILQSEAEIESITNMCEGLVESIAHKTTRRIEAEVPDMAVALVTLLKKLPKEKIITIVDKVFSGSSSDPIEYKKKSILRDIIPTCGHRETPAIISYIIKSNYVSSMTACTMLDRCSITVPASIPAIRTFMELSREVSTIRKEFSIKKSAILGASVLTHKIYNLNLKMGVPPAKASSEIKEIIKEFKSMLEESDIETRIMVLKAVGNVGVPELLSDIERIIKDNTLPTIIRKEAINAVRRMAPLVPKEVKAILLPVYLNPGEKPELRIAAFRKIISTRPTYSTILTIVHYTKYDPSQQVASYVHSYLQSAARSSLNTIKPISEIAKKILKITPPVITSPLIHSKFIHWDYRNEITDWGIDTDIDIVRNNISAVPDFIMGNVHSHVLGVPVNLMEIGSSMKDIDTVIRKIFGTEGKLREILEGRLDVNSILSALSEIPKSGIAEETMRRIFEKTSLPIYRADETKLGAYLKVLGHEVNFFEWDKDTLKSKLEYLISGNPSIISYLTSGYDFDTFVGLPLLDNVLKVPTPMGLPMALKLSIIGIGTVTGNIRAEGVSSLTSLWSNPSSLKIKTDLSTSFYMRVSKTLAIDHEIFEIGVSTKSVVGADIPIKFDVEVEPSAEKIVITTRLPKSEKAEIVLKTKPVLITQILPVSASAFEPSSYSRIVPRIFDISTSHNSPFKVSSINTDVTIPIVDMRAKIEGTMSRLPAALTYPYGSLYDLSKQELIIKLEPGSSTPEAIMFEIMYGDNPSITRDMNSGWFSGWFGNGKEEEDIPETSEEEFIPVTPSPKIRSPIAKEVIIHAQIIGGSNNRKTIKSKLTMIYNPSWTIVQKTYQLIIPSLSSMSRVEGKVMINIVTDIPKTLSTIMASPMRLYQDTESICSIEVGYGRASFKSNKIVAKVKPYIVGQDPTFPHTPVAAIVEQKPLKNIAFKVEVDYSKVPETIRNSTWKVVPWINYFVPPTVYDELEPMSGVSTSGRMIIFTQIIPVISKMNAIIALPTKTVHAMDIKLYEPLMPHTLIVPDVEDMTRIPMLPEYTSLVHPPKTFKSAVYGNCTVLPRELITIDNISISWPENTVESTCEVVLAQDCSPQKLFTVVTTPVTSSSTRGLMIVTPHIKVELTPSMAHMMSSSIKINGEVRTVSSGEPLIIEHTIDGRQEPAVNISKEEGGWLIIDAMAIGLVVETDGVVVKVKVSPILFSTLCGICTHEPRIARNLVITPIREESYGEFQVTPSGKKSLPISPIISKYLVESDSCRRIGHAIRDTMSYEDECRPMSRNIMINRSSHEVCFSVNPASICPTQCRSVDISPISMGFTCIDRNSVRARSLMEARHERILTEVSSMPVDKVETIDLPQRCTP